MDASWLLMGGIAFILVAGGAFGLIYWLLGRGSDDDSGS
jgi:hypothetical protein